MPSLYDSYTVTNKYTVLSLRAFSRRRAAFSEFLATTTSLTAGRYFRLMALAMTEMMLTVPLSIVSITLNATSSPLEPWRSWADTHFAFSRVEQYPAILWRANSTFSAAVQLGRWIDVAVAFIFFAYFGFASEARIQYCAAFWAVAKLFGVEPRKRGMRALRYGRHLVFVIEES